MTLSSSLEAKLRGRAASSAPSDAAGKVLGVEPRNPEDKARFSSVVHWGYGTSWGAVRGLIHAAGLRGHEANGAHLIAVWGAEQVMLPALGVAPPLWASERKEIAIDLFHHIVYALATGLAFTALQNRVA